MAIMIQESQLAKLKWPGDGPGHHDTKAEAIQKHNQRFSNDTLVSFLLYRFS